VSVAVAPSAPGKICARLGALSDPVRWRAVELLAGGERCVCDLEAELGVAQSRLSYHLGILRRAGLVAARREGRWMYYALAPDTLERLAEVLGVVAEEWRERGAHVEPSRCS
jgi:ArsR family transcriptional regulator